MEQSSNEQSMEQLMEKYRSELQRAFDVGNTEEILKVLKTLNDLNVEIPFTVEVQEHNQNS